MLNCLSRKGGYPIGLILKFVVAIFIVLGLFIMVSSAGNNASGPTRNTISNLSSSSYTYKDILYCKFNCVGVDACTKIPPGCAGYTKAGDCILKPTCAQIEEAEKGYTPSSSGGGSPSDSVTFSGTYLPGGTVKISLSTGLKTEYDPAKFKVFIEEGGTGATILCDKEAGGTSDCLITKPKDQAAVDKVPPDPISIRLPYERDTNNIETKIAEGVSYTISLSHMELVEEKVVWPVRGKASMRWSCPKPTLFENPKYTPQKDVVFNFSPDYGWIDISKYDAGSATIEIGKRTDSGSGCYKPSDSSLIPTCKINAVGNTTKDAAKPTYWNYKFLMPYVMSGQEVAVSYPVYATGISIDYTDSKGIKHMGAPLCRSGEDKFVWNCPEKACYEDSGKTYLVSLPGSGSYVANAACKYSAIAEECVAGCREVPLDASSMTSECVLPKPDIVRVFMRKLGMDEYKFNDATGNYELNKGFALAQGAYSDKKWAVVVIKNSAPSVKDASIGVPAKNIDVTASLGAESLTVMSKTLRHKGLDGKWTESAITATTSVEPQDYIEYEVDIVGTVGSDTLGKHSGTVSETIDSKSKIASDSIISSAFSYSILNSCCDACKSCSDVLCPTCGARCAWIPEKGAGAYCKKVI